MTADGSPSMPSSLSRCLVVVRLYIQSVSLVCIDPNQSRTHPLGSTTAHNLILARPVLIGRPTLLAADEHDVRTGWLLWEAPSRRPCWRDGGGITAGTFLGPERHPAPAACCGGEVSSSRAEARLLPVHGVREDFPDAASHGRSLQRARTH